MLLSQVLKPQLAGIKSTAGALKAGLAALKHSPGSSPGPSKPKKAKQPKPAYLELMVNLQQIVFSLEQHPLETWMGLHGPLLQSMAAERHLTEQLLASCASARGRISRSGGSGAAGKEGAVAGRGGGRQPQRFGSSRTQAKQWQSRRWGTLGKKGTSAVLSGIAAGSVSEAAGAAAAEVVAASGPLVAGLTGGHPAGHHASPATPSAGPGPHQHTPPDAAAPATPAAAGPRRSSDAEAGAAADASDAEPAAGEVTGDETSDDTDSSDVEGAIELADPDALAAALPSSAQELAASAGRPGSGPDLILPQQAAAAAAAAPAAAEAMPVPADAAAAAAVLSAAAAAGEAGNGNTEMAQAVLQAHRELFEMYKYRCRPLDAAAEDEYNHCRAVMHVSCVRAEAVVLVCLPGNAAADAIATEVCLNACCCTSVQDKTAHKAQYKGHLLTSTYTCGALLQHAGWGVGPVVCARAGLWTDIHEPLMARHRGLHNNCCLCTGHPASGSAQRGC